jgi:hypothetical protein
MATVHHGCGARLAPLTRANAKEIWRDVKIHCIIICQDIIL